MVALPIMARREIFGAVAQQLQRAILRGELPADLPAERDLALRFRVSRPTIRKALQILRAQGAAGLMSAEHGARAPVDAPLLAYIGETGTHFYQDLFVAIAQCAQEQGFRIASASIDGSADLPAAELAALSGASAVICMTERLAGVRALIPPTVPVVVVGLLRAADDGPARCVWGDRRAAAALAVEHLISAGHRQLACIISDESARDGAYEPDDSAHARTLVELGFLAALQAHGLTPCAPLQSANRVQLATLRQTGCTAVVCDMDFTATRIYAAAQAAGLRIPQELSVVGIGDTPWCRSLRPELTSIDFRPREIATYAVAACGMGLPDKHEAILVQPRLIIRHSVCKLIQ